MCSPVLATLLHWHANVYIYTTMYMSQCSNESFVRLKHASLDAIGCFLQREVKVLLFARREIYAYIRRRARNTFNFSNVMQLHAPLECQVLIALWLRLLGKESS